MRKLRLLGVLVVVAATLCCLFPLGTVQACAPPCYWSGTVEVNGVGVEAGTAVSAWINGTMYAETTTGSIAGQDASQFRIAVLTDDPATTAVVEGGATGDEVVFKIKRAGDADWITALIDGQESAVFYYWHSYYGVLLTVGGVTPVGEATLEGQVHLEGREASSGDDWVISLNVTFLQDSTVVRTLNITTNDTGVFNITDIVPGTYNIRVKNSHTLSNLKLAVVFTAGEATVVDFGTLLEGDANDDNVINIYDFSLLADAFGTVPGDPAWDARCDFNADSAINTIDFSLLSDNFGLLGE